MDVLCCKITIGDANPSNPMEIKDAIEITEVQSIEINETYKKLIGSLFLRLLFVGGRYNERYFPCGKSGNILFVL